MTKTLVDLSRNVNQHQKFQYETLSRVVSKTTRKIGFYFCRKRSIDFGAYDCVQNI